MAARKRAALERAGSLSEHHRVVEIDALVDDRAHSLGAVAGELDHGRGLAVITEGLISYLDREGVLGLWRRIARRSGGLRRGIYLSDIHLGGGELGGRHDGIHARARALRPRHGGAPLRHVRRGRAGAARALASARRRCTARSTSRTRSRSRARRRAGAGARGGRLGRDQRRGARRPPAPAASRRCRPRAGRSREGDERAADGDRGPVQRVHGTAVSASASGRNRASSRRAW